MRAQADRSEDKRLLQKLSDYLQTSYQRIRLDECGDWNIIGSRGHVFTDAKLWYVFVGGESKRSWNSVKSKLKFMELSQDGDAEGILKLERMPSEKEAETLRKVLGLRKRTILSEEDRALLKIRLRSPCSKGVSRLPVRLND